MQGTGKALSIFKSGAIGRALERLAAKQAQARTVRIGLIVDATGSRQASWEDAQRVQGRMLESLGRTGRVLLRLIYFGGGELTACAWSSDHAALSAHMAAVRCRKGHTQILDGLRRFLREGEEAESIILVGDAFEEDAGSAELLAALLRDSGAKIFAFLEGDDAHAARIFRKLAEATGGRFARLGAELPLGALCEGVVLLTAHGREGLRRLKHEKARLLLTRPAGQRS